MCQNYISDNFIRQIALQLAIMVTASPENRTEANKQYVTSALQSGSVGFGATIDVRLWHLMRDSFMAPNER